MGNFIEEAEAHAELDGVLIGADARDDFAEDAGAVLKAAAVFAGAGVCAEEFVEQVTVAVFEIYEISSDFPGDSCGADEVGDQRFHFGIGKHLIVTGDVEFAIQQRVAEGDARFPAGLVMGTAEAAGVGELKADEEIVGGAVAFGVGGF